jgi:hypothetical protein
MRFYKIRCLLALSKDCYMTAKACPFHGLEELTEQFLIDTLSEHEDLEYVDEEDLDEDGYPRDEGVFFLWCNYHRREDLGALEMEWKLVGDMDRSGGVCQSIWIN